MIWASILLLLAQSFPFPGPGMVHAHSSGTWSSIVQWKENDSLGNGTGGTACTSSGSATSCQVTIAAPTAGNLLIAVGGAVDNSGLVSMNSTPTVASGSNQTWIHCAGTNGCSFGNSTNGSTDAWYVLSAAATGQTNVICNFSHTLNVYNSCMVLELHWSGTSVSFDVSAGNSNVSVSGGNCAAQALTLTGTTDYIFETAIPSNLITNTNGGNSANFTNPKQFLSGQGFAGAINATVGTAFNWTDASGTCTVMGIAFKGN